MFVKVEETDHAFVASQNKALFGFGGLDRIEFNLIVLILTLDKFTQYLGLAFIKNEWELGIKGCIIESWLTAQTHRLLLDCPNSPGLTFLPVSAH